MAASAEPGGPSTTLDVFDPALRADPFPAYRALRAAGPVHPTGIGIYLVPRYAECDSVFGDPTWGHGYFAGINPFRPGVDPHQLPGSFLLMDPPDHTRLRGLVSKAFTPRAVAALRPRITKVVDELLDAAIGAGEVDIVSALAYPVPLTTICQLLGVPPEDHVLFGSWARDLSRGLDPDGVLTESEKAARAIAVRHFAEYFTELIAQRRRQPADDLLSALAQASEGTDSLSDKELVDIGVLLLIAGHETTMNLIAGGVLALGRHPDQWALLRSDPELVPLAVEEFLRYDTPVPFPTRVAMRDTELGGRPMPRGTGVILLAGSANHDEAAFPDPERLDVTRFHQDNRTNRHLAFSHGPHFCLGAPLARLEAEITFDRLARRAKEITVLTDQPVYRPSISMRGPESVPVRIEVAG
ncbi:MAG TPA: cytochrome P450 [Pseudonocardiaceae bacterium]|jgi:hypothetical protein|nr:cytochrome P450 [Pseudonocardiaceae bacterium]